MRSNVGGKLEFLGLNLTTDKYSLQAGYAIVANDVRIKNGRPTQRLGRLELSEDQLSSSTPLGLHNYATPAGSQSMVLVRADGIFQRKG